MLWQALEGLAAQFENLTSMKLEKLRLTRLVKQLQEREVDYMYAVYTRCTMSSYVKRCTM
jgi:hypothetical protein